MNKTLLKDSFVWGSILWFIGYLLGFFFYAFVPIALIGWFIMPIAIGITLFVLFKYVKGDSLQYFLIVGVVWTILAVILDYIFIVQLLHPADGYYKFDVYLYYVLTLVLPPCVYWLKTRSRSPGTSS